MTDNLPATAEPLSQMDAYALLTKPTLDLTDAEVDIVIADLRARRARHISSGKPDKPNPKPKALPAGAKKPSALDKAQATLDVLSDIDWKL